MKAKVGLVFSVMPKEVATWPYKGFDYDARVAHLSRALKENLPDVEWTEIVARNPAEFKELPGVGAYAVVIVGIWNGVPMRVVETGKPTLLIDDLYGGSGEFLLTLAAAQKGPQGRGCRLLQLLRRSQGPPGASRCGYASSLETSSCNECER